ncbi:MAG: type II toxin-antitoxin system HipA family toxin [Bacteroidales bacterium]|nr:type II toxin-antitoxin system HipA family toxin [Bacteroidales bacterium]MCF8457075.1 type II toxin-antitoxin system HipA family toxin [Bacteroidales bacterium]
MDSQAVGRMGLSPERLCIFEYAPEFLLNGFSISPFYLPLRAGIFTARREPFDGLFGIFNDSLPDGWGNLLLDRYLRSKGIQLQHLSVLDRLSIIGSSGMGALRYEPENRIVSTHSLDDIEEIAREVKRIISEIDYTETIDALVEKGGSSGGAGPKVLLHNDDGHWIVKFPSSYDSTDIGQIEYQYSLVAKKCGIEMPETKLFEEKYFGARRFDRVGEKRVLMHSASGLLYANHRLPSLDYVDLIKATLALTKNMEEAYKLFRQMVFNVLTGNKDDHAKNFSFLFKGGQWQLSPAYDLVPSSGFNGNHSTTVAGEGNPSRNHIFEVAKNGGLKTKLVHDIFEEVYGLCPEIRKVNF